MPAGRAELPLAAGRGDRRVWMLAELTAADQLPRPGWEPAAGTGSGAAPPAPLRSLRAGWAARGGCGSGRAALRPSLATWKFGGRGRRRKLRADELPSPPGGPGSGASRRADLGSRPRAAAPSRAARSRRRPPPRSRGSPSRPAMAAPSTCPSPSTPPRSTTPAPRCRRSG